MKAIEALVVGSLQDLDGYWEDMEGRDGVVFALAPSSSRPGRRGGPDGADGPDGHGAARTTLRNALGKYSPRKALFLAPYRGMSAVTARLMESGVEVRLAGPLPAGSGNHRPPITEVHRSDPGFKALLASSRHADFGEPVYLRVVSSPEGGTWQKWWCVFQMCRKAAALLGSPLRRVYVATAGKAPLFHVTVTLKTARNSTGHLLVAPCGSGLRDDIFFLGTGGTLSDDPLLNQPGIYGESGYRMLSRPVRRSLGDLWTDDAVISLSGDELRFYRNLLRAIGGSAGSGEGSCLEYPAK